MTCPSFSLLFFSRIATNFDLVTHRNPCLSVRELSLSMTCKRARIGRSISRIDVLAHSDDSVGRQQDKSSPPCKMAKNVRHSPVEGRRHSVLVAPSSIQANDREANYGFLDSCHFCKRKILQDAEVFMYSTFLAFCSSECRKVQILVDKVDNLDNERDKHLAKLSAAAHHQSGTR